MTIPGIGYHSTILIMSEISNINRFSESEQLKNESGQPMTLQGSGFASVFQMENETFTLAPSATQWSDPDMTRQFSTKSGAVAKFSWRGS